VFSGDSDQNGNAKYQLTYTPETNSEIIVQQVDIEVRPLSNRNTIYRRSFIPVPVIIYSRGKFDATDVDARSLTLGRTGNEDSLFVCNWRDRDYNRDGFKDKLCWFKPRQMDLEANTLQIILKGKTYDDLAITGKDTISVR
jgi:hypothetical protein